MNRFLAAMTVEAFVHIFDNLGAVYAFAIGPMGIFHSLHSGPTFCLHLFFFPNSIQSDVE